MENEPRAQLSAARTLIAKASPWCFHKSGPAVSEVLFPKAFKGERPVVLGLETGQRIAKTIAPRASAKKTCAGGRSYLTGQGLGDKVDREISAAPRVCATPSRGAPTRRPPRLNAGCFQAKGSFAGVPKFLRERLNECGTWGPDHRNGILSPGRIGGDVSTL